MVIISCVRSGGDIGFLREPKRLNVALTRAKRALYVVLSLRVLLRFLLDD